MKDRQEVNPEQRVGGKEPVGVGGWEMNQNILHGKRIYFSKRKIIKTSSEIIYFFKLLEWFLYLFSPPNIVSNRMLVTEAKN